MVQLSTLASAPGTEAQEILNFGPPRRQRLKVVELELQRRPVPSQRLQQDARNRKGAPPTPSTCTLALRLYSTYEGGEERLGPLEAWGQEKAPRLACRDCQVPTVLAHPEGAYPGSRFSKGTTSTSAWQAMTGPTTMPRVVVAALDSRSISYPDRAVAIRNILNRRTLSSQCKQ